MMKYTMSHRGGAVAISDPQNRTVDSNRRQDSHHGERRARQASASGDRSAYGDPSFTGGALLASSSGKPEGDGRGSRGSGSVGVVQVNSEQLGKVDVPEAQIFTFADGIPGFAQAKRFCLLEVKPASRFKLLQSVDIAELAFVVIDPLTVDPSYPISEIQREAQHLFLEQGDGVAVASIVTISPPQAGNGQVVMTANLIAPLVMGTESRRAAQLILNDSRYQVRHAL